MQLVRTVAPYGRTASFLSAIASTLILIYPKISISAGVNVDPNNTQTDNYSTSGNYNYHNGTYGSRGARY